VGGTRRKGESCEQQERGSCAYFYLSRGRRDQIDAPPSINFRIARGGPKREGSRGRKEGGGGGGELVELCEWRRKVMVKVKPKEEELPPLFARPRPRPKLQALLQALFYFLLPES
jgi:hypothetical protein